MSALPADFLAALAAAVEARSGTHKGSEIIFTCPSPAHEDKHPSARYNVKKAAWTCDVCGESGGAFDLGERVGVPLAEKNGASPRASRRKVQHVIRDVAGVVIALHDRKGAWYHPDGTPSSAEHPIHPSLLPLYGSERLHDLADGAEVVVVEGEKAADALRSRGIQALGTFGTSAHPCDDSLRSLLRLRALLWPDNDNGGREHIQKLAHALHRLGHRDVHLVHWSDAPDKGDAADFTGDDAALRQVLDSAVKWEPAPAVDLAELLDNVHVVIRRYVVLTDAQADTVALWIAHTHALDAFDVTPYLSVTSPEKRSGKTRLLEVNKRLVARSWMTARTSPAALYRRVDAESPTLLLDESDAAFKSGDEYSEALRGVLNSGFERGGSITVCVGQGKDITYKEFSTFGAKAIAGIGRLPDTIQDRAIKIAMKRQAPGEKADKLRRRAIEAVTAPLREQMAQWALVAVATLATAEPAIPDELDDRASDAWEPLLAIADLAGEGWPQRARRAAQVLSVGDDREDDSLGVRLLQDVRIAFEGFSRLPTPTLLEHLTADDDAPWGDMRGKPLDARRLARMLKVYGVKRRTLRDGAAVFKGYAAADFTDAWARYLPSLESRLQGLQGLQTADTDRGDVTDVTDVTANTGMGDRANGRHCKSCPQPLSVIALGDECGRCKAETVTT